VVFNAMAGRLLSLLYMARRFTDLIAWQLARELKMRVYQLVKQPDVARDWKFVDQIVDAAASAPRNIAEGFGRFNKREFANFLKIAIASEQEVRNHFIDAVDRGFVESTKVESDLALADRAIGAATRLRQYLLSGRNRHS
jgi:four helix bundle protein